MSTLSTAYEEHLEIMRGAFRRLSAFKKVSLRKLQAFSPDLTLVALSVRTGYLFDAFSFDHRVSPLQIFEQLIQELRKTLPSFRDVVVLTDPDCTDFFFVKVPLLLKRLEQGDLPAFLALKDQTATPIPDVPYGVRARLNELHDALQEALASEKTFPPSIMTETLGRGDSPADVVPLAAVLLEYPIAYAPVELHSGPFLSNVDLDVFTCSLGEESGAPGQRASVGADHTILQFSCPSTLAREVGDIVEQLRRKFSGRLSAAGVPHTLQVSYRTERLDRVAL